MLGSSVRNCFFGQSIRWGISFQLGMTLRDVCEIALRDWTGSRLHDPRICETHETSSMHSKSKYLWQGIDRRLSTMMILHWAQTVYFALHIMLLPRSEIHCVVSSQLSFRKIRHWAWLLMVGHECKLRNQRGFHHLSRARIGFSLLDSSWRSDIRQYATMQRCNNDSILKCRHCKDTTSRLFSIWSVGIVRLPCLDSITDTPRASRILWMAFVERSLSADRWWRPRLIGRILLEPAKLSHAFNLLTRFHV